MKNELMIKPTFNGEIKAEIKSLGEIESNMNEVKTFANNLNEYYSNIIFDEESMKLAKEEKAKVNKFKTKISDYRKDIVKQWKEPITQFETMAKETETLLSNVYDTINIQCNNFDEKKKIQKRENLKAFFDEYVQSKEIDFIGFENVGLNITLNASEKSLKEQIIAYVDKIKEELRVIDSQENKTEILVEYKQCLDLNKSILIVNERKKRLQEEMQRQQELIKKRLEEEKRATAEALQNFVPKKQNEQVEEEIVAPTNITEQEKTYTSTFKVKGTMAQLSALKEYLKNSGLEVEY